MAEYVFHNGKKLKTGFTTGVCAAAAAKAAAALLFTGKERDSVELAWRAGGAAGRPGAPYRAAFALEAVRLDAERGTAVCGVRKDAGDDVDVTDGLLILAAVRWRGRPGCAGEERDVSTRSAKAPEAGGSGTGRAADDTGERAAAGRTAEAGGGGWLADGRLPLVVIDGGTGVGRVTMAGLDQPVGEAAINSGPRRMIRDAVRAAWLEWMETAEERLLCESRAETEEADEAASDAQPAPALEVVISAPGGEALAAKTFNPVLGIEGGLSILGTTGIVEPMSGAAVAETVRTELRVRAEKTDAIVLTPGNTGALYAEAVLGIPRNQIVQCSNYVGEALDEACLLGLRRILLVGALGKFVKLAGGIFNTHSHESDARLDILIRCALRAGCDAAVLRRIDTCITTDGALEILEQTGTADAVLAEVLRRAMYYLRRRSGSGESAPAVELILLSRDGRLLKESAPIRKVEAREAAEAPGAGSAAAESSEAAEGSAADGASNAARQIRKAGEARKAGENAIR